MLFGVIFYIIDLFGHPCIQQKMITDDHSGDRRVIYFVGD